MRVRPMFEPFMDEIALYLQSNFKFTDGGISKIFILSANGIHR